MECLGRVLFGLRAGNEQENERMHRKRENLRHSESRRVQNLRQGKFSHFAFLQFSRALAVLSGLNGLAVVWITRRIELWRRAAEMANVKALLKRKLVFKNRKDSPPVPLFHSIFRLSGIRSDLKEDFEKCAESDITPVHFTKSSFEKL